MRKQILTLVLLMLPLLLTAQKTVLSDWQMESTLRVSRPDAEVSAPGFPAEGWHPVTVPSTVLSALVKEGVYPDPRVGMDNFSIPDVSDAFNERLGIPGENLWKDPWWYRTEFTLAETLRSKEIIWLHLDGINYRADIWVNGRQVASHDEVVGMFRRFRFNITKYLRPGRNVLAVKVWQTDHPGMPSPGTQFILFGPNRGNAGDIFRDETLKMSGGWDCAPVVRDRNMGLWQQVWLSGSDGGRPLCDHLPAGAPHPRELQRRAAKP